jgi:hypothetical protein
MSIKSHSAVDEDDEATVTISGKTTTSLSAQKTGEDKNCLNWLHGASCCTMIYEPELISHRMQTSICICFHFHS